MTLTWRSSASFLMTYGKVSVWLQAKGIRPSFLSFAVAVLLLTGSCPQLSLVCPGHRLIRSLQVLPCSKQYYHDWLVCAFTHPGEAMCRRDPTRFAYTGIACPDKKVNNGWTDSCKLDSNCILKDWQGSQDGHCKRGESCPYSHNTFEYWLHPTRYCSVASCGTCCCCR